MKNLHEDILNNNSLSEHTQKIESIHLKHDMIEQTHIAYLIKNMHEIKKLIATGDINNNMESVISSIQKITNNQITIEPTEKIVKIFKKNKILPLEKKILDDKFKQDIYEFFAVWLVLYIIFGVISLLVSLAASYEVDYIETYLWLIPITFFIRLFIYDD